MKFIKLTDSFGLYFGSKKRYTKTQQLQQSQLLINGTPSFLNPENWEAYNIFITTPQVYAVISRKGSLMAAGQWKHYKVGKDGKPEIIENSDVVKFLENPNPLMNGNDYIKNLNESKCIFGNSFEYKLKAFDSQEIPSAMYILPASEIDIKTTGKWYKQTDIKEIIDYYSYNAGVINDRITPDEMIHMRITNSSNPLVGESPLKALFMPISNIREAYGFRNVIMTKKGALGILSNQSNNPEGAVPLTPQERKRIEGEYQRSYGLDDDQMQLLITESNLSYQPMSYPTQQLMLFEEIEEDFKMIIDTYGLNDNLFSKSRGSTFENQAAGIKQAYQSTIIPEAEELAMNRSKEFGLIEKGEFLELDYSHIPVLQENQKEMSDVLDKKASAIKKLIESGIFSSEEIKDIVKL